MMNNNQIYDDVTRSVLSVLVQDVDGIITLSLIHI